LKYRTTELQEFFGPLDFSWDQPKS
jgi:hypothetical protein